MQTWKKETRKLKSVPGPTPCDLSLQSKSYLRLLTGSLTISIWDLLSRPKMARITSLLFSRITRPLWVFAALYGREFRICASVAQQKSICSPGISLIPLSFGPIARCYSSHYLRWGRNSSWMSVWKVHLAIGTFLWLKRVKYTWLEIYDICSLVSSLVSRNAVSGNSSPSSRLPLGVSQVPPHELSFPNVSSRYIR